MSQITGRILGSLDIGKRVKKNDHAASWGKLMAICGAECWVKTSDDSCITMINFDFIVDETSAELPSKRINFYLGSHPDGDPSKLCHAIICYLDEEFERRNKI